MNNCSNDNIPVSVLDQGQRSHDLASRFSLPLVTDLKGVCLSYVDDALTLNNGDLSMCGDFSALAKRLHRGVNNETIVKAVKIKNKSNLTVLDATAGLGEDSFILASAGFSVHLYEYNPVIFALLEDAFTRAQNGGFSTITSRMTLHFGDSITAMQNLDFAPDVIFLDPMFPEREKSALIKKKFQLLHELESPCTKEPDFLASALGTTATKIVIKRPEKGAFLSNRKPSYQLHGQTIRYDCIVK